MEKKVIKIGEIEIPFEKVAKLFPEDATEEEVYQTIVEAFEFCYVVMEAIDNMDDVDNIDNA